MIRRASAPVLLSALALSGGCANAALRTEPFVSPVAVVEVGWQRHLTEEPLIEYKPQEFAAATSDGRRVFVGSSAADLWAFDARDGHILWRRPLQGGVAGRPRLISEENLLVVGTMGGFVYGLDPDTGAPRWSYELHGPVETQPTYEAGIVYFTSGENRVYALDAQKGTWRWQYDRELPEGFTIRGYGAPLATQGRVYVGFADGHLTCLNGRTGEVLWTRNLGGEAVRFADVDATPVLDGGTLYAASYATGVWALDPRDGSTRWRFDVEGAGTVRAEGGRLYFSAPKLGVHCLDRAGRLVWRQSLAKGGELSAPLPLGRWLFVSAANQGTYVADAQTGRLAQFFAPGHGVTGEPTTDGRQIYVLSNGGYFFALRLRG